jgi:hypothetical protein
LLGSFESLAALIEAPPIAATTIKQIDVTIFISTKRFSAQLVVKAMLPDNLQSSIVNRQFSIVNQAEVSTRGQTKFAHSRTPDQTRPFVLS